MTSTERTPSEQRAHLQSESPGMTMPAMRGEFDPVRLGKVIERLRKEHGFSVATAAGRIDMQTGTWYELERGGRLIGTDDDGREIRRVSKVRPTTILGVAWALRLSPAEQHELFTAAAMPDLEPRTIPVERLLTRGGELDIEDLDAEQLRRLEDQITAIRLEKEGILRRARQRRRTDDDEPTGNPTAKPVAHQAGDRDAGPADPSLS